jgi:ABC-type Fe3+/spermidine/putrescine transport system ATPase subunit
MFQSFALFNHMTVGENIRFGMKMRKLKVDPVARYVPFQPAQGWLHRGFT